MTHKRSSARASARREMRKKKQFPFWERSDHLMTILLSNENKGN
jgi:hypothetical protein